MSDKPSPERRIGNLRAIADDASVNNFARSVCLESSQMLLEYETELNTIHALAMNPQDTEPRESDKYTVALLRQLLALIPVQAEPVLHQGECATDESARQVCEAMYVEKVDEVLALIEALEAVATLNAGTDPQSIEVRGIALKAIGEQGTDVDARNNAARELRELGSPISVPRVEAERKDAPPERSPEQQKRYADFGYICIRYFGDDGIPSPLRDAFNYALGREMKPDEKVNP